MSKRARDHGDKRDWQKKWAENACPINWQAIGTSSQPPDHQRKAERIAERTQQQSQPR
ncbi:hypothetical protein [Delftia deserti]|uniref:Uncharacterized protein n=1 Tax=Delftia deserti TaxID=1651218 RepID=A0ABW5EP84_9BURK